MSRPAPQTSAKTDAARTLWAQPVAVIDVGATSIRMAVAQIDGDGNVETLEALDQPVSLGQDTFTRGAISRATTEACVGVLQSYRRLLEEYQISEMGEAGQVRAIATSAVREATNRDKFLDRVYIGSGIRVEAIDEAEVNRLAYLGVQPFLAENPELGRGRLIMVEVGGGVTKVLLLDEGNVEMSHATRLGALRLREMLKSYRMPTGRFPDILRGQIDRAVDQIRQLLPSGKYDHIIAQGGDVRFAAAQLLPDWDPDTLGKIPLSDLAAFTERMLGMSIDDVVRQYRLPFQDAETLGTALLSYSRLAEAFGLDHLLVTNITLRDGLLKEMVVSGSWTEAFQEQIIRSATMLGRKFDFNEAHAMQVGALCRQLFHALQSEHKLDARYELLLYIAALLHEIGVFVSNRSHHKHSMYLILNSSLFGLGQKDLMLVALTARYHRRATPRPAHEGYAALNREDRIAVSKMAAILRVADALERSHSQRVRNIHCRKEGARFVIAVPGVSDLSLEQLALKQKGSMFEEVYGKQVMLRKSNSSQAG